MRYTMLVLLQASCPALLIGQWKIIHTINIIFVIRQVIIVYLMRIGLSRDLKGQFLLNFSNPCSIMMRALAERPHQHKKEWSSRYQGVCRAPWHRELHQKELFSKNPEGVKVYLPLSICCVLWQLHILIDGGNRQCHADTGKRYLLTTLEGIQCPQFVGCSSVDLNG